MAATPFDYLQILLQLLQVTRNLASNMNTNAATWLAMAQGTGPYAGANQPSIATIAGYMKDASASYVAILTQANAFATAQPAAVTAACALIGSTSAALQGFVGPLEFAALGLGQADLSTYALIATACNNILTAVPAPLSVVPGT